MGTIEVIKDIQVPMRDGVSLATDVYRRTDIPAAPTLLQRLPYNKEELGISPDLFRYVGAGYAMVVQDTRGRFASGGDFRPFHEAEDGADTIAWAAAQEWSNGNVGMLGMSYWGATQWQSAETRPPALRAIAPFISTSEYYDGWIYQGGAFRLGFALFWAYNLAVGEAQRRVGRGDAPVEELLEVIGWWDRLGELYDRAPLADVPCLRELAPFWQDWLDHPSYDDYWADLAPEERHRQVAVPALNVGGWYDIFLGGTLRNYEAMKSLGSTQAARSPRLIVGPWAHAAQTGQFFGRAFGIGAGVAGSDLTGRHLLWFDRHLKGEGAPDDAELPVRVFVMGADEWREEADWPLPGTEWTSYYLHSGGSANTSSGNGWLSTGEVAGEPADSFVYDPAHPVPTVGGATLTDFIGANAGPHDQSAVESRPDVLCYTTPPLEEELEVIGPVELVLHVSSSAPDTDFTGKLVDVGPDGRAELLTDGVLRARYRNSLSAPELLSPGEVYEISIDLGATANRFRVGHRIRLEVSSSNFPKFDRNTNTGGVIATEDRSAFATATNRVHHDRPTPSRLVLPVIGKR